MRTIENAVLQWEETSAEDGDFEARRFLYRKKEFGHLHDYGDLDIFFNKQIQAALLLAKLVQPHKFIPKSGITYTISSEDDIPFALSLLRFSYLLHFFKVHTDKVTENKLLDSELAKLPESLSALYRKQKNISSR